MRFGAVVTLQQRLGRSIDDVCVKNNKAVDQRGVKKNRIEGGASLNAVLDVAQVQELELRAEILLLEVLVALPVDGDHMVALALQTVQRCERA